MNAARLQTRLGLVAAVGAAVLVAGAVVEPERAAFSYLAAWATALTLALGALFLVMIHHATGSTWFITLRRTAENAAATLPLLALLFVPILFAMPQLFPWTHLDTLEPVVRESVAKKTAYLNVPFFLIRAAIYWAVWLGLALTLRRWSRDQADGGEQAVRLARRQKTLSAVGLIASALCLQFASVDWLMSLSPGWASSVFAVYVFAGCMVGAMALMAICAFLAQRAGALREDVTVSHYHGVGKLLFTFIVFWAYIGFFQFFIIWIADVPEEAKWYVDRMSSHWAWLSALLVAGHFVLPFFVLLSRELKRRPARLALVAAWMLAMHAVDVYWIVVPAARPEPWWPDWIDLAAFAAVGGAVTAFALWQARRLPDAARGDPRFAHSLRFETR